MEDEYLAREELVYLVNQHSQIEIVASFEDGLEGVQIPAGSRGGMWCFWISRSPPSTACCWPRTCTSRAIRLTSSSSPPTRSSRWRRFELEAFDYILKPYNEPRIINLLQKLEHAGKSQPVQGEVSSPHNRTINLVKGERIIVTPCEQIYYAEADEKLTYVYTRTDSLGMTMALSEFVQPPAAEGFFRCHRSYASTSTRSAR